MATLNGTKAAVVNETVAVESVLELPELDYIACKSVDQSMLILKGDRLSNPDGIKGLSGKGEVMLQIGDERLSFGTLTEDTLSVNKDAMSFLFACEMSSEDILSIALDAKKAWCLNFKVQLAAEKAGADKIKKQSKIDKKSAILAKIKGGKN